jgi:AcrR family transcriptional regulator
VNAVIHPVADIDRESPARERLIQTAERLFAVHGVDAVSLNRIRLEAGEKNGSAINYHFGSKEALIRAIFESRMAAINQERLARLTAVDRSDRYAAVRGVVEALVLPLAARLDGSPDGCHYVRFVAQVYGDPRIEATRLTRGKHDSGVRTAHAMLREIMADVPARVVLQRFRLQFGTVVHALADWEKAEALPRHPSGHLPKSEMLAGLIDGIVGLLTAPVSAYRAHQY